MPWVAWVQDSGLMQMIAAADVLDQNRAGIGSSMPPPAVTVSGSRPAPRPWPITTIRRGTTLRLAQASSAAFAVLRS